MYGFSASGDGAIRLSVSVLATVPSQSRTSSVRGLLMRMEGNTVLAVLVATRSRAGISLYGGRGR